jgi:hypothetical protein
MSFSDNQALSNCMAELRDLVVEKHNIYRVQELAAIGRSLDRIDSIWRTIVTQAEAQDWVGLKETTSCFHGNRHRKYEGP